MAVSVLYAVTAREGYVWETCLGRETRETSARTNTRSRSSPSSFAATSPRAFSRAADAFRPRRGAPEKARTFPLWEPSSAARGEQAQAPRQGRLARGRGRGGDERARHGRGRDPAAPPGPRATGTRGAVRAPSEMETVRFVRENFGKAETKMANETAEIDSSQLSGKITEKLRTETHTYACASVFLAFSSFCPTLLHHSPRACASRRPRRGFSDAPLTAGRARRVPGAVAPERAPGGKPRGEGGDAPAAMGDGSPSGRAMLERCRRCAPPDRPRTTRVSA